MMSLSHSVKISFVIHDFLFDFYLTSMEFHIKISKTSRSTWISYNGVYVFSASTTTLHNRNPNFRHFPPLHSWIIMFFICEFRDSLE